MAKTKVFKDFKGASSLIPTSFTLHQFLLMEIGFSTLFREHHPTLNKEIPECR
jgi:hypothetical protein